MYYKVISDREDGEIVLAKGDIIASANLEVCPKLDVCGDKSQFKSKRCDGFSIYGWGGYALSYVKAWTARDDYVVWREEGIVAPQEMAAKVKESSKPRRLAGNPAFATPLPLP